MTQPGARERSLRGCATCRTRHVKCDEGRPECSMCTRSGLICGGYEIRLTFCSFDDPNGPATSTSCSFRRPLFTEQERKIMSEELVTSTYKPAARLLFLLDEECDRMMQNDGTGLVNNDLSYGPFGVFKLVQTSQQHSPLSHSLSQHRGIESDRSPLTDPDYSMSQRTHLDDIGTSGDLLLDITLWDFSTEFASGCENLGSLNSTPEFLRCFTPDFRSVETQDQHRTFHRHDITAPDASSSFNEFIEQQIGYPVSALSPGNLLPSEATYLLSHYRNSVIGLLSPPAYHKMHWHILHLPSVMHTFAVLTLGDSPGNASLSIFFGILAISAFSLRSTPSGDQPSTWDAKGGTYRLQAQQYLKLVLQEAFCNPKRAKYKDVLMCLLTMVTVSMFSGNWEQTECFLLDAESFIRYRGLTKPRKSRKVRLLHHSYAYHRLFHESTHFLTDDTNQGSEHERVPGQESSPSPCRKAFRLAQWSGTLDKKLLEKKSLQQGIDDLHLEIPGDFTETLYPDTFGIPESFLALLSQIIRLGNEKDICDQDISRTRLSLGDFFNRATVLEKCVIQWNRPPNLRNRDGLSYQTPFGDTENHILSYYHLALYHALTIYFYRRIYNLDASMLQEEVKATLDALTQYEQDDSRSTRYTSGIVWPGFIAACEALDPEVQDAFRSWFDRCAWCSGLKTFELSKSAAEQIWKRRRETKDNNISLHELIKSQSIRLFYS
ncbi:hypothetical protein K491DRAFT_589703 [Lophiostoma macrostomum CBS 122681]|uniref:Zn(2)-C6 fungal-type domain-containing protein n=1 Tax=Lophiostoma macrostomum CBS 122681 TaxID=1314788 RepID=A0A6A6TJL5_9PLEO|nr:hypothetical protein K491DRAFT_589703 [Lophiostoma macrostomum CBS 122681]